MNHSDHYANAAEAATRPAVRTTRPERVELEIGRGIVFALLAVAAEVRALRQARDVDPGPTTS